MFNDTYTSLCFKLRPLVPCTVCSLKTRLDLLPDGAVELLLVGTHPGFAARVVCMVDCSLTLSSTP